MNNANKSAFPTRDKRDMENKLVYASELGLTKREYFVAIITAGALAGRHYNYADTKDLVKRSIECADELLDQLSKTETP